MFSWPNTKLHFVFGDGAPDPGTETAALASPALASGFFTTEPPGKPFETVINGN